MFLGRPYLCIRENGIFHAQGVAQYPRIWILGADRQSAGGCLPVVCAAGMNPAHSWHTTFVRERDFAVGLGMHSFTSEKHVSRY